MINSFRNVGTHQFRAKWATVPQFFLDLVQLSAVPLIRITCVEAGSMKLLTMGLLAAMLLLAGMGTSVYMR